MNKCVSILYKDNEDIVKKEMLNRLEDIMRFVEG